MDIYGSSFSLSMVATWTRDASPGSSFSIDRMFKDMTCLNAETPLSVRPHLEYWQESTLAISLVLIKDSNK